jgi:hypothetical protein
MAIAPDNPFKGRQHPGELILLCVRWYLRYPLSYEHVAELMAERGVEVDASCIWRWVQAYAPELNKRCRPFSEAGQQELSDRRNLHQGQRRGQVPVSSAGFHRANDRLSAHRQT